MNRMKTRTSIRLALSALLIFSSLFSGNLAYSRTSASSAPPAWAYDPGPDPDSEMGKELIDIVASQPNMPGISVEMTGEQKFRPAFGPTLWRMLHPKNSIQILFIGQDGTHIAEAAGRTATAGFGGRAQDLAAHFGVHTGAAFMNAYAFTIKGQYGAFEAPIITMKNSQPQVKFGSFVDNGLWLISHDQNSPMVKWRNSLIDWIIRNNPDSLKLIVLFGGAARDAIATFIESKGVEVATRTPAESLKNTKVPLTDLVSAGGNKVFPVLLDEDNHDLYSVLAGRRLEYRSSAEGETAPDATLAMDTLKANLGEAMSKMAIANGGLYNSGVLNAAQIGGYDLRKDESTALSLKGLELSDGSKIRNEVLVVNFPHPSSLSMMTPAVASQKVGESLELLKPYAKKGWEIEAEAGLPNKFAEGKKYEYKRTDISQAYYDFGTPNNRMVNKSDASRMSGNPNIVVLGTRDRVAFNSTKIKAFTDAPKPDGLSSSDMFTARPRNPSERYVFDRGPGEAYAKIMKENLDLETIGKPKSGKTFEKNGIAAYNIKSHPEEVGDFGHYRGTFEKPEVIVLADPDGADDILTSRALTGTRGQYLQSLLESMGVDDKYLVIKTVPFGMDGATEDEWATVLEQTEGYRDALFEAVLSSSKPKLVIADGPNAAAEAERILADSKIPVVSIERDGTENDSGLSEAAKEIAKIAKFKGAKFSGKMANIPRSHLPFLSRVWEGTSGSRVLEASDSNKGLAYAVIVPKWAFNQKLEFSSEEAKAIREMKSTLDEQNLPLPNEKFKDYKKRMRERGHESRHFFLPQISLAS